eukprot:4515241-Amphidinium_carterae.1
MTSHAVLSKLSLRAHKCARGQRGLSSGDSCIAFTRTSLQSETMGGRLYPDKLRPIKKAQVSESAIVWCGDTAAGTAPYAY